MIQLASNNIFLILFILFFPFLNIVLKELSYKMDSTGLASGVCVYVGDDLYYIGYIYIGGVSPLGTHSCGAYKFGGNWVSILGSPDIFTARSGHCGFASGYDIYVFGGQNEAEGVIFAASFKFDTSTYTWTQALDMPEPRHSASCVNYKNQALIFGGANQLGPIDSLLIFNPGKN